MQAAILRAAKCGHSVRAPLARLSLYHFKSPAPARLVSLRKTGGRATFPFYGRARRACYPGESLRAGEMAEWLKAHAWKACIGETLSRVRIPLSPPV